MTVGHLKAKYSATRSRFFHGSGKPYVRWWWLAGPFTHHDIARQLQWVYEMGFGGVEIAWILPSWLEDDPGLRPEWLSAEWSQLAAFTKQTASALDLGCDFTFGSCWPFGGSWIERQDAAQTFFGPSGQRLGCSWEQDTLGPTPVLNHLSAQALHHYAQPLLAALRAALNDGTSALFCDSLELHTEGMWSEGLWNVFEQRFGYSLQPYAASLDQHVQVRYDYRCLISEMIRREFYEPFTSLCHAHKAYSRVQCHGAPTDLLAAYAAVDVPESETLLFPPAFSRIAASAAAWAGKPVVSAEAFTCIYGFPGWNQTAETHWREEHLLDLKLIADSLFVNGVNQIIWHGMPFQPQGRELEFYASVHVAPDTKWVNELPEFNQYLTDVSTLMQLGRTYSCLGVYLPIEDALLKNELQPQERSPGANYYWEMRHAIPPLETESLQPLWISQAFLREAYVEQNLLCSRQLVFEALYVDCEWLDSQALQELVRLAADGANILCRGSYQQPGHDRDQLAYRNNLHTLAKNGKELTKVKSLFKLVETNSDVRFFARVIEDDLLLFFAHPVTRQLIYPLQPGFAATAQARTADIVVRWRGQQLAYSLRLEPCESAILSVDSQGSINQVVLHTSRTNRG